MGGRRGGACAARAAGILLRSGAADYFPHLFLGITLSQILVPMLPLPPDAQMVAARASRAGRVRCSCAAPPSPAPTVQMLQ